MEGYENYDITENDPYTIDGSGGCLKNLLGIMDTKELNDAEAELTKLTMADLAQDPVPPTWNLEHLKQIHFRMFQDVYPFAGEIRESEISKGDKLFLPYKMIEEKAAEVFGQLANENHLQGLSTADFGERAGFFMGQVNMIHPFREGNGRSQRIFFNQLADLNGYIIEWSAISDDAMGKACREARTDDESAPQLRKLLRLHTVNQER